MKYNYNNVNIGDKFYHIEFEDEELIVIAKDSKGVLLDWIPKKVLDIDADWYDLSEDYIKID